jgi:hypothetical protein
MSIIKLSEGAFFVPSYSLQTITPAYDTSTTIQALTPNTMEVGAQEEDARRPIQGPAQDEDSY